MPKKTMTPEEKKAWGEKMKAARAAKKTFAPTPEPGQTSSEELEELKVLVKQMQQQLNAQGKTSEVPSVSSRGVVGTFEKFSSDPTYYPSPVSQLFDYMESSPQLRRFGFRDNYELNWEVAQTRYQTIDGVWTSEPRFRVELIGIIYDDDTYEKTDKRYIVRSLTFHEDPDAAVFVAQQNGIEVDEQNPRQFLDEMRYLRVRQWLHDTFFPEKLLPDRSDIKDQVIGNKLVQVFTSNSRDSKQDIPFDKLKKL